MLKEFRPALLMLAVMTLLTGVIYPSLITGLAQVLFPQQAHGSFITTNSSTVGSALVGQSFSDPKHFWGRLSATNPMPYHAGSSSGSNLGPLNPALEEKVASRMAALKDGPSQQKLPIPVDLVTSSGSGLDPHISPAAALWQVPRIAKMRGLSEDVVQKLVLQYTEGRTMGILGEPRVNVLLLNLALDKTGK